MSDKALLKIPEAATFLNISTRKCWAMRDTGELPGLTYIGRCVRVNREVLAAWVREGCPDCRATQR